MINISIVIPIFNEEKNICNLIYEINKNINKNYIKFYEIIIIDDFSTDKTQKVIEKFIKKNDVRYFRNSYNAGQSYSIHKGIKLASYQHIVTIDGDGQNNPTNINDLVKCLIENKQFDLIGGIRFKRQDSFFKIFASKIANFVRSSILNDNCVDTGCSLKIFNKKIFLNLPYFNSMHRFLPALFKGFGYKTFFIDVDHRPRKFGKSKYNNFSRLIKGVVDLVRVYFIIKNVNKQKHV